MRFCKVLEDFGDQMTRIYQNLRSLTEPFDLEMEFKEKRIKNWFTKYGLISSEKQWHQVHVSGHGDGEQIKQVIDGINAKKLIPIHTDPKNEVYHKKMA